MTLSNSGNGGAASAVPSTPEEAEQLLRDSTSPEQVRRIYLLCDEQEEDWRAVKLKAERRFGELIGPSDRSEWMKANTNASKNSVHETDTVRRDRHLRWNSRKVAAVPQAQFDAYLASTKTPTRAGLLRKHGPKEAAPKSRKNPTFAGKRQHQIKRGRTEARKNGRPLGFWEIGWDVSRLVYAIAGWKVEDVDLTEDNVETMLTVEEDLLYLYDWMDDTISLIHSRLGENKLRGQVRKLREKTVANGCTPEEADAASRAADRLERKISNRLTAVA